MIGAVGYDTDAETEYGSLCGYFVGAYETYVAGLELA